MDAGRSAAANKSRIAFQDVTNRVEQDDVSKLGKGKGKKRTAHTMHSVADVAKVKKSVAKVKKSAPLPKTAVTQRSSGAVVRAIPNPNNPQPKLSSSGITAVVAAAKARDIDERDSDNPLMCTSYVQDMYQYFRTQESRAVADPYMGDDEDAIQPELTEKMRAIHVDWLVDIHHKMKYDPATLHLAVQILDRFLATAVKKASKKNLQLIGAGSFYIASKYEEIYTIPLRDFTYVCGRLYTEDDILSMETTILKALTYQISLPTSRTFLVRFLNAAGALADRRLCSLTQYILEKSLHSSTLVIKYTPSQLAAAAVLIGRFAIGRPSWSATLVRYAEYGEDDIIPIAREVMDEYKKLRFDLIDLTAVERKYSRDEYYKVIDKVASTALFLQNSKN